MPASLSAFGGVQRSQGWFKNWLEGMGFERGMKRMGKSIGGMRKGAEQTGGK